MSEQDCITFLFLITITCIIREITCHLYHKTALNLHLSPIAIHFPQFQQNIGFKHSTAAIRGAPYLANLQSPIVNSNCQSCSRQSPGSIARLPARQQLEASLLDLELIQYIRSSSRTYSIQHGTYSVAESITGEGRYWQDRSIISAGDRCFYQHFSINQWRKLGTLGQSTQGKSAIHHTTIKIAPQKVFLAEDTICDQGQETTTNQYNHGWPPLFS